MLNDEWMKLALLEAKKAEMRNEVPVGAILIDLKDQKLIEKSRNNMLFKSSPIAHAEIGIIMKSLKNLKRKYLENTAIYVTLEPCMMCAAAISEARIQKVFFGAYDSKKGAYHNNNITNIKSYFKPEVYGGIMEEECSKIISNFFKKIRLK